jgi:hypothetical protein
MKRTLLFVLLLPVFAYTQAETKNSAPPTSTNSVFPSEEILQDTIQDSPVKLERMGETKKLKAAQASSKDSQQANMRFQQLNYSSNHRSYQRSLTPVEQQQMQSSLNQQTAYAPSAFETQLNTYLIGRHDINLLPFLLKAAAMKPNDPAVRQQLLSYYHIVKNTESTDSLITCMKTDGSIPKEQSNYGLQLMQSIQPGNTLIIHGYEDLIALAEHKDESEQVVVSIDLMQSEAYRTQLAAAGFVLPDKTVIDTAYVHQFCKDNVGKKLQLSVTIPKDYLLAMSSSLFPMGLTFAYNPELVDTYDWNNTLWNQIWNQSLLTNKQVKWPNNYLPMLLSLRKQYELTDQPEMVAEIERVIKQITSGTANEKKVNQIR